MLRAMHHEASQHNCMQRVKEHSIKVRTDIRTGLLHWCSPHL